MTNRYRSDPFWTTKRLTPAQLQVHDINFVAHHTHSKPRLEINEVLSSNIVPEDGFGHDEKVQQRWTDNQQAIHDLGLPSRIEKDRLLEVRRENEWMSEVRLSAEDDHISCRWVHISSSFPENLKGVFAGMSDWTTDGRTKFNAIRELDQCVVDQERSSKHGKHFAPFCTPLGGIQQSNRNSSAQPLIISIPFFDWSVHPSKETPALRFQVDEREKYYFARAVAHPLRSLLQYYYRLEDTSEREQNQVLAKHRPWYNDRDMDLKVRRWYGYYPASMVVDELWILIIDDRHIVTFSSNQSWKARWPALQLSSRIAELSFRGMRNFFDPDNANVRYSSIFHLIACLHGAVGLMHRSFWTDLPLPCTERYGDYLSHLQYRIYRSPSTRLVMDLLQTQDELNICHDITQKQLDIIAELNQYLQQQFMLTNSASPQSPIRQYSWGGVAPVPITRQTEEPAYTVRLSTLQSAAGNNGTNDLSVEPPPSLPTMLEAIRDIRSKLQREGDDLAELQKNSNDLITRTIQLVNIRMEDHGQDVLVFTVVTVIFLPLSFTASFFGINTADIRNLQDTQWVFWASGLSLTVTVVILSVVLAFYGARIHEILSDFKAGYLPHDIGWLSKLPFAGNARARKNRAPVSVSGQPIKVLNSTLVKGWSRK